jgi:hypothetical protein
MDIGTYARRVGPQGGTRYDMYTDNWIYGMCMSVLDIQTMPRGDVPSLGLTDGDIDLLGGWIVTS